MKNPFKVGDYIQINLPEDKDTLHSRAGVRNEDVGIVNQVHSDGYLRVTWLTGKYREDYGNDIWGGEASEMKHSTVSNRLAIRTKGVLKMY